MSPLELRHTIESGLLPLKSQTIITDGFLTVEIPSAGGKRFVSESVLVDSLVTSRDILNFIGKIRTDMSAQAPKRRSGAR